MVPPISRSTAEGFVVNDADAAAEIEKLDVVGGLQFGYKRGKFGCRFGKGSRFQNL